MLTCFLPKGLDTVYPVIITWTQQFLAWKCLVFEKGLVSFILRGIHLRNSTVIFLNSPVAVIHTITVCVRVCLCAYVYVGLCMWMCERLLLVVGASGAICWVFHKVISNRINYRYSGLHIPRIMTRGYADVQFSFSLTIPCPSFHDALPVPYYC
jgi:hypothetical protein